MRYAALAALLEGEASGYELSKRFHVSVGNFWSATPQQLYRELERLEAEGFVRARVVEQRRRPNKRVFALTETGREALRVFTAEPVRLTAIRDELLIKVQAVDLGEVDAVRAAIEERMKLSRTRLARYDQMHEGLLEGRSEEEFLRTAERVGPYLTLMRGRSFEQENLRWFETALAILDRRVLTRCAPPGEGAPGRG